MKRTPLSDLNGRLVRAEYNRETNQMEFKLPGHRFPLATVGMDDLFDGEGNYFHDDL